MGSLSIQDWGAIGEIVGAGAVFVSLIYLAVQIRQNTRQLRNTVMEAKLASLDRNVQSGNHLRELMLKDAELSELFLRGVKSYSSLERTERFRMDLLLRNMFSEAQRSFVRVGMLKTGTDGPRWIIDSLLVFRGVREWLGVTEMDWLPEFRAYVDERLALHEETPAKAGVEPAPADDGVSAR